MNKKLEVQKIKIRLGELYGGVCFICQKSKSKSNFTIHHCRYIFSDIVYKGYPKTVDGQLQYYKDLEPLVKADPSRFLYLCNTDHVALERINRYRPEKLIRILEALLLTNTNHNPEILRKLLISLVV